MAEESTLEMNLSATYFKLRSTHTLKNYFAIRKKSIEGSHKDFAVRAFACYENNVLPLDINKEQNYRRQLQEYQEKLNIDLFKVPDPLSIKSGWNGEEQGMINWPSNYFDDIDKHFEAKSPTDFINRLHSEYKQGKAYHYVACELVQEFFYHKVSEFFQFCIMKTKVTPSPKTSQKDYIVWIIVTKDKDEMSGGKITSAYCQCTAGLMELCNHIGGTHFV